MIDLVTLLLSNISLINWVYDQLDKLIKISNWLSFPRKVNCNDLFCSFLIMNLNSFMVATFVDYIRVQ